MLFLSHFISAAIAPQCQCQAISTSALFLSKPKLKTNQVSIFMPESSNNIIALVKCMPDCELNYGYFSSSDMGNSWEYLGDTWPDISDSMWVFGKHPIHRNVIYRSIRDSATQKREWFLERSSDSGQTWQRKSATWMDTGLILKWITNIQYHPRNPDTIYAIIAIPGTVSGCFSLFVSKDGGDTFTFMLGNVTDLSISTSDPSIMYVVSEMNCILKTEDGGQIWELTGQTDEIRKKYIAIDGTQRVNELFRIVVDPQNSKNVYVSASVGIFRTNDGGSTWCIVNLDNGRRYGPSSIVIYPSDSRTIFIGTIDSGLFRSEDGGCTWQKLDIAKRLRRR